LHRLPHRAEQSHTQHHCSTPNEGSKHQEDQEQACKCCYNNGCHIFRGHLHDVCSPPSAHDLVKQFFHRTAIQVSNMHCLDHALVVYKNMVGDTFREVAVSYLAITVNDEGPVITIALYIIPYLV